MGETDSSFEILKGVRWGDGFGISLISSALKDGTKGYREHHQ